MQIDFQLENRLFHLYNAEISYVIGVLENGHLGHFHFGPQLSGPLSSLCFRGDQNRGLTPYVYEDDFRFSLNLERLEFPVFGTSDFREPAFVATTPSGSRLLDFQYKSHKVTVGKPDLLGLPSTRSNEDSDTLTLTITLRDTVAEAELLLTYTLFRDLPVLTRHAALVNTGDAPLDINRLMSFSMDLMDADWDWLQFSGDWIRERHLHTRKLCPGIQSIGSKRGASSAQHNPFVILKRAQTTETEGEALGALLVYSGNFALTAEVDSNDMTRLMGGIHPEGFSWRLDRSERFDTPEAILCYSGSGLGHLSRSFHKLINSHLIPPPFRDEPRPVLFNSWEAAYFQFNEAKLLQLAKAGAALGMDLFVLDDGWFGQRDDDTCGLGDWTVNYSKLPNGLKGLAEKVSDLGLKFGLWIEPEMINKGTHLFEAHPDWIIADPARKPCQARHQFILDYSRPEVVDHIYNQLTSVLDDVPIHYLKWDMNRNMTDCYSSSLPPERQGELAHRYMLGVYGLYERLTHRYPQLLIESCSAGGGRFDPGMLYYAPQAWTSDNTDAISRLKIQYGTSYAYPLSAMGAHVSASPNHQVMRQTSLKTRGDVALFGAFGYELDLTQLNASEKQAISSQIAFFKAHQKLLHHGDFYRLLSPFEGEGNETAWMVVSVDQNAALVGWYQTLAVPNQGLRTLRLTGLDPLALYTVTGYDIPLSGSLLTPFGLLLRPSYNGIQKTTDALGDYQSRLFSLSRVDDL